MVWVEEVMSGELTLVGVLGIVYEGVPRITREIMTQDGTCDGSRHTR